MKIVITSLHLQGNMIQAIKNILFKPIETAKNIRKDGWMNVLSGLGTRTGDKVNQSFFRACPVWSVAELDDMYRADGLTRRIIDIIPSDMIRQGWEVEGDADNLLKGKYDELNANVKLAELTRWARLYGGGLIVMGIADGRPLSDPVNVDNIYDVMWLHIFDRYQAQIDIACYCTDFNSENYSHPEYYNVQDYRTGANFTVHHSRVLRMDWGLLPPRLFAVNAGWGDSVLTPIFTEIRNFGLAMANTSAMMQDFVNGVFKIPGLSQTMTSECGEKDLLNRVSMANLSKSVTQAMIIDGEEDFQKLSTNVSGVSELIDRFMLSVSSVTGIPASLLFGRAPAGLNATGDSDIRNYYDMIKQYQEVKLRPLIEKLNFYIMKSWNGPFKGVEPENWHIEFTPLWQNTEEQEAILRRTVAETDSIYIDRGVLDPNEVAVSRFGGDRWSMNTIIDLKAREQGYDPNEIEDLEYEKELEIKEMPPEPTIGPEIGGENETNIIITG